MEPIGSSIGDPYKYILDLANDILRLASQVDGENRTPMEISDDTICSFVNPIEITGMIGIIETGLKEMNSVKGNLEAKETEIEDLRKSHLQELEAKGGEAKKEAEAEMERLIKEAKEKGKADMREEFEPKIASLKGKLKGIQEANTKLKNSLNDLNSAKESLETEKVLLVQKNATSDSKLKEETDKYNSLVENHNRVVANHCRSTQALYEAFQTFMGNQKCEATSESEVDGTDSIQFTKDDFEQMPKSDKWRFTEAGFVKINKKRNLLNKNALENREDFKWINFEDGIQWTKNGGGSMVA